MFDGQLAGAFHFTWADVESNRGGQLTGDQEQYLKWRDLKVVGLCGAGIGLIPLFSLAFVGSSSGCLVLIVVAGLLGYIAASYWPMDEPYWISSIEGAARLRIDRASGGWPTFGIWSYYVLEIQGYHFYINGQQFRALEDGTCYAVYYVTREKRELYKKAARKTILSIARIVEDKNHVG